MKSNTSSSTARRSGVALVSAALMSTTLLGITAAPAQARSNDFPSFCESGRIICIDKSDRKVRLREDGKSVLRLDARFGASRSPTREGMFRIFWKNADHVSSKFGSPMPFSLFFSGGQAIHYSSDFLRNGYGGASHGCVNTREYSKMRRLFEAVRVGDRVWIQD
ncbi:MAG: L,D-transpeptidase [Sporichthyaceae bacterium]